jgi:curli production assembly/transport component CsgF
MTMTTAAGQEYQFSNPSFSGDGWSQHVIMLEQMQQSNKKREQENSNLNRFLNNFESRVYAQLSKMLVDKLFGEDPQNSGSFELAGNTIDFLNDGVNVELTITDPDGNVTTVKIPVGGLGF